MMCFIYELDTTRVVDFYISTSHLRWKIAHAVPKTVAVLQQGQSRLKPPAKSTHRSWKPQVSLSHAPPPTPPRVRPGPQSA